MAKNSETLAFSERLKQALTRAAKKIRTPSELALQFNLHHAGQQITNQAAQKWLTGASKPTREKIETLARLCKVSAQWLRYGVPENPARPATNSGEEAKLPRAEAELLRSFRTLSAHQQTLITELVTQLALAWETGEKP
ncbi:MAG: hypothetical protein LBG69_02920 [Zoogloeaceae bacterium]|jgi:hypothetical protein|nr:hypothetical protein [Zoogloeaceae bacterium]